MHKLLYVATNSQISACDQSPITKEFHWELLSCKDQPINILTAMVAWLKLAWIQQP